DRDVRILLAEARDERQQRVDRRFVRADQDAAAAEIPQFADGRFGFFREPHEPLTVVLQHAPRFGERAGLRRPVEQLLAEFDLEAAHRLADRGLSAVHLGSRARKAALVGDREEDLQRRQVHNYQLFYGNHYHFDFYCPRRYKEWS